MKGRSRDIRQPIPVARAISWRPLHGVDHVLAMLQPGATPRDIFIAQETLCQLDGLARSAASSVGVLLGALYECPDTRAKYVVIDSLIAPEEQVADWASAASAIVGLMASQHRHGRQIVGWYSVTRGGADHLTADEEAFHRTYFDEPWYTALRLTSDQHSGVAGTFFRRGALDPHAFRVPFYELLDRKTPIRGAKPTCIAWPTYLTADVVVAASRPTSGNSPSTPAISSRAVRKAPSGRSAWRALRDAAASMTRRYTRWTDRPRSVASPSVTPAPATSPPLHHAASAPVARETAHEPPRSVELDDTSATDSPSVFVEIARADGFFLAARFDFTPDGAPMESLWVLQDPFAGLLLLLSATASTIIDATLHYNLCIDDPDLFDATFSEYRDVESRTVYVKDTCVDRLRARCAALRESGALRPEWIVSPTLYLLTPSEWAWLAEAAFGSGRAVRELNRSRILALPEPVIRRFRLAEPVD